MADYIFPYGEAPDSAEYVVIEPNPNLPNAKELVAGANITIDVGADTVTISSTGGGTDNATFITASDETADLPNSFQIVEGPNVTLDYVGNQLIISASASGTGGGTVTEVISGNANPVFTTNVSTATTTPTISYTLTSQASATFLRGPASGATGSVFYGGILGTDLLGALTAGSNITITPAPAPGSRLTIATVGLQPQSSVLNALASSLTGTGYVVQTGPDAFAERTFQGSTYVSLTNPAGIAGDTTISLSPKVLTTDTSDLLNALSSATGTGLMARTAEETVAFRSIQGSPNVTVTAGDGVSDNPSIDTTSRVYTLSTSNVLNAFATSTATNGFVPIGNNGVFVPGQIIANSGVQVTIGAGLIQIGASGAQGGTLTDLSVGNIDPLYTTQVDDSTTIPSVTFTLNAVASGASLLGPKDGTDDTPTLRRILGQDLTDALVAGSNVTLSLVGDKISIASSGGGGGVSSVDVSDLVPLFTTVVNDPTTTVDVQYTLSNASSGTFFSGPASGGPGAPGYRGIYGTDLTGALLAGSNITIAVVGERLQISATGSTGYSTIQEDGNPLTQRDTINFVGSGIIASDDDPVTEVTLADFLNSLVDLTDEGVLVRTDSGPVIRTIEGFPGQVDVSDGDGVADNPVISLSSGILAALATGVQSVAVGNLAPIFTSNVANPTTTPSVTYTLANGASGTFLAFPASGSDGPLSAREIVGSDIDQALQAGSNITLTLVGDKVVIAASGSTGYTTVEEEGTPLTQRSTINFVGSGITAADVSSKTQISLDATLEALATYSATGLVTMVSQDSFTGREIAGTPNEVTVANGNGVDGNLVLGLDSGIDPTLLADGSVSATEFQYLDGATSNIQNQLNNKQGLNSVLNALSTSLIGTGYIIQSGPDTFVERSLATANSNHISITNPSGVAGASTFDIGTDVYTISSSNVLNDLASSTSTGVMVQTNSAGIHAYRTIQGTGTNVTVTQGNGVAGDPTIDVGANVYTRSQSSLLNYLASTTPSQGQLPMGASDGSYILTKPNAGTGVQLDFANGIFTISATGAGSGGGGYATIQEEGTPLTQRTTLNVVGAALTASDDSGSSKTQLAAHTSVNSIAVTPTNGQIPIGNGTNFTVAQPIAGRGIQLVAGSGTLSVLASGANATLTPRSFSGSVTAIPGTFHDITATATVTLPSSSGLEGQTLIVRHNISAGGTITINTTGGESIDNYASGALTITVRYVQFEFRAVNGGWTFR